MSDLRSSQTHGAETPGLAAALEQLTTLHEGFGGVGAIIAVGAPAIEPLKAILWRTEIEWNFQLRHRAIMALAALGADDVLIEFIGTSRGIADPTMREGENATISIAARALKGSRDPRAFAAVLRLARRRPVLGAMETLAASHRIEAIPGLIRGLDEDDTRGAAIDGLRGLGRESRSALLSVALAAGETPSALRKRRAAMRLLSEIGLTVWQWPDVRPLIHHADPALSLHACRALSAARDLESAAACKDRLTELAPRIRPPLQQLASEVTPTPSPAPGQRTVQPRRPLLHLTPRHEASE